MKVVGRSITVSGSGTAILDTNTIIALWHGKGNADTLVSQFDYLCLPLHVLGELYYGAFQGSTNQALLEKIAQLLERFNLLLPDAQTAHAYGTLKAELRSVGALIPESDIWIASCAIRYGLPIITRDKHFERVPGIVVHAWEM